MIRVKCNGALSTVADHVVPVRQGGQWSMENGQGACDLCHQWKRATLDKLEGGSRILAAAAGRAPVQTKRAEPRNSKFRKSGISYGGYEGAGPAQSASGDLASSVVTL
jgi:hypothetical protein